MFLAYKIKTTFAGQEGERGHHIFKNVHLRDMKLGKFTVSDQLHTHPDWSYVPCSQKNNKDTPFRKSCDQVLSSLSQLNSSSTKNDSDIPGRLILC